MDPACTCTRASREVPGSISEAFCLLSVCLSAVVSGSPGILFGGINFTGQFIRYT